MSPILGIIESQKTGKLNTGSFESIATLSGNNSTSVLTFSSIPNTYKHLQIRIYALAYNSTSGQISLRVNGDTTANYVTHSLYANGTGISTANIVPSSYTRIGSNFTQFTDTYPVVSIVDILDYSSSTKKQTIRALSGVDKNTGTSEIQLSSGFYTFASAINSIDILNTSSAYSSNTKIALYGIKG